MQRGGLRAHGEAREVLRLGQGAFLLLDGDDGLLGLVVAGIVVIGEVEILVPLGGPAVTGDGHIHAAGLHGGLAGVEAHGLDHQVEAHFFRDELGQGHVKAHILVLAALGDIHELHGGEVRGDGHGKGPGSNCIQAGCPRRRFRRSGRRGFRSLGLRGLLGRLLGAAAQAQGRQQHERQRQRNDLLHFLILLPCLGFHFYPVPTGTWPSILA